MNQISKNSLYAMVDLYLDYLKGENVDNQRDNITEFIINCHNLTEHDAEFKVIQEKFEEEFENSNYFTELNREEVISIINKHRGLYESTYYDNFPSLIQKAIDEVYGGPDDEYTIPVTWVVAADVKVRASSLDEAIMKAKGADLPEDGEFVEGSFVINVEEIEEPVKTMNDHEMQEWLEIRGHTLYCPEKDNEVDMEELHKLGVAYGFTFNKETYEWSKQ